MSIPSKVAIISLLIIGTAYADGITGSTTPQVGGGIDKGFDSGINSILKAGVHPSCTTGSTDLSTTCGVLTMTAIGIL